MKHNFTRSSWLVVILCLILSAGFLLTSVLSYLVTKNYVINSAITQTLPLLSDNIYSGIKQDLTDPINISSLMANDSFLIDWVTSGETDVSKIADYLNLIKEKYGYTSTFFVSDATRNYYHYNGILKEISPDDSHDIWYYDFKVLNAPYELDVDTDEAKAGTLTVFINHRLEKPDGTFLGVTGVGIQLEDVGKNFQQYQDLFQHEIMLVDQTGLIQIHSDENLVETTNISDLMEINPNDANLFSKTDEVKIQEVKKGDGLSIISIRYIPEFNWYLIVSKDEVNSLVDARKSLWSNIFIGLSVTIIVSGIIIWLFRTYNKHLEVLAAFDSLTDVYNRRFFMQMLRREIAIANRAQQKLALLMIDIDDFKSINDNYGHITGDECLQSIVLTMKNTLRASDLIGRWGGDEFVILLTNTAMEEANKTAVRILKTVDDFKIHTEKGIVHRTISIGLAVYETEDPSGTELIKKADDALMKAKGLGRNTISE